MRKTILHFFGWVGIPLAFLLLPVFCWIQPKGLNGFEIIERAEAFQNLCGMVTFVALIAILLLFLL